MIKLLKRLRWFEWVQILVCMALIVVQVWLDLKLPEYMSKITKLLQTPNTKVSAVLEQGGYMLGCALISLGLAIVTGYFASKVSTTLSHRLRQEIYCKVENFSMQEIKNFSTSSLVTRTTNDVTQVQTAFAMAVQLLVKAPVMAIWAVVKIAGKGWQWSLTTALAVVLLVVMLSVVMGLAVPRFKKIQKLTDNLNRVTRENLTGVRVVRAYNAEDYQQKKFEKANKEVTDTHLFVSRVMSVMNPGMTLISSGITLAIYWIGAYLIKWATNMGDKITLFSDMVVYSSYAMQVVMAFMMLILMFMILPRASVSAKRINEVLDTVPNIVDGKGATTKPLGEVEFKNVSFKYPDAKEYVVKDVNFKANKGDVIAFIGSTGSGKSTLVNLIPRFYDVSEGELLLDGENVKNYTLQQLHNKIGYISQKAVLFAGTINSNINFGETDKQVTEEDIEKASKIAQASNFIENLPEKYNSHVAQGGTNLSGGQKQRISIARALARKPEILIFDDSFSALDYKTDKILRAELKNQMQGVTTFIVAQRIGTIKDADKIVVIDDGNVVGMGTHEELLKNCKVYQEIAYSQLSKEELENA